MKVILEHLDKSYGIEATDQLDSDLAAFLDYTWHQKMGVEQFIAGFHTRLDKIAELNIDTKLKGHLLLRQAGLDTHTRNMIVGAASGKYDASTISNALRQAYRNTHKPASMASTPQCPECERVGKKCSRCSQQKALFKES